MDKQRLEDWLESYDTGMSSKAIFHYMTLGITPRAYPHDAADLGRCLRLLARFPEWKPRLPELAPLNKVWAALVARWDELEASFIEEAGGSLPERGASWNAPKTYELMKAITRPLETGFIDLGNGISMKVGA